MTGPSSRVIDSTTTVATAPSAANRLKPVWDWRASTMPVNIAVKPTTGSEKYPILTTAAKRGRREVGGGEAGQRRRRANPPEPARAGEKDQKDRADRGDK